MSTDPQALSEEERLYSAWLAGDETVVLDGDQRVRFQRRLDGATDPQALVALLEQKAEEQRDMRGDMLYRGQADPWLEQAAAQLRASHAQEAALREAKDEAVRELESALAIRLPDWAAWAKDLRKAAVRDADPLDDETLDVFRHAVADNHCKPNEAERFTVRRRVGSFAERYGRRIIARIDAAEARATALERQLQETRAVIAASHPHQPATNSADCHFLRVDDATLAALRRLIEDKDGNLRTFLTGEPA